MKKFLFAGSSLATVAAAGSVGAVDVTLGGAIDMGVEFGIGKEKQDLTLGDAYNNISLSLAAAGTTDAGMKFGGSFTFGTAAELEFSAYEDDDDAKHLVKMTVEGATDIEAAAYNVSGGQMVSAKNIVGVKINSEWMSVGDTQTGYGLPLAAVGAENICKVAGQGKKAGEADLTLTIARDNGTKIAITGSGYLPAGKLIGGGITGGLGYDVLSLTAAGAGLNQVGGPGVSAMAGLVRNFSGRTPDDGPQRFVRGDVYVGPFAEVKLQSSSTKMVVGAVCVEGIDASETNYFMDVASKVLTASDASVFIEGGFGKITLQTGDFAGGVSAIGGAGDEADLDVKGLGVIVEGVGLIGGSPFIAFDLSDKSNPSDMDILTGGTMDFGGLSAAVDVMVNSSDVVDITSWDLGLSYAMGDMNVAFAYDSGNDWGLTASMAVAGFAVDATFASDTAEDHEKSGITYAVNASTSLNGFGLSLGVDQDMKPTVGLSKSMGGLSLYAGYDAADKGGKVGATLSF